MFSRIVHPTLAWRLGLSWLLFGGWAFFAFSHAAEIIAFPFMLLFLALRWGIERYKHGEPRFLQLLAYGLFALFLVLVFLVPSDFHALLVRPAGCIYLVLGIALALLGIYRDYRVVTGRVTLEPPAQTTNRDA